MSTEYGGAFDTTGSAYDSFMGRYSLPLAVLFADAADVVAGQTALDLGCGPGALTGVLVDRLGADAVAAIDRSPQFVTECTARHPGVDVRIARVEELPFDDDVFDRVLSQLVLHFVEEPARAATEVSRVLRPGGSFAACVWDFEHEMEMLRHFWDAALAIDPSAPDEARTLRFGRVGELSALLDEAGFSHVAESSLEVASTYSGFEELWSGFLAGIGPAGSYCVSLSDERRGALRAELYRRLGSPGGMFTLRATARCAVGATP